jgi:amino acid transporter
MLGAAGLGVGSMVGAGVFALMGEAAMKAGSAVWLSFLMAGVIALLTGHSFVQLGIRYPSRGGVVEYLARAYGPGTFSGGCSILFYIAQLVGMSMIALSFGKFASHLIGIENNLAFWERVLASGLILGLTAINLFGSQLASRVSGKIVLLNIATLSLFAVALATYADPGRYSTEAWPQSTQILGSLALTFFAFTGFAVVSNTAGDMANPARDLPRAMYLAIGTALLLYVCLALAVVGAVQEHELTTSGATLLAVAARSHFGDTGFTILLISAVAATITCLNGGLFGVTSITFTLAEKGQLPPRFKREVRASTRGLTISALLALLILNLLTLTTVASLGSATSLLVYFLVNFGARRLIRERGRVRWIVNASVVACAFAILVWMVYTVKYSPGNFPIFLSFLLIAFVSEFLLQRYRKRIILPQIQSGGGDDRELSQ